MLSCETARAELPGLATGERPSPELREHLASCDACRVERERCVGDVERIREGLAELAPSPFLEDQVVDALRVSSTGRPRRPWAYVAAAGVAAAALFLVVVLPRLQDSPSAEPPPHAIDEGALGRASIQIPPSAKEVSQARSHNRSRLPAPSEIHALPEGEELHQSYHRGGRIRKRTSPAFLPPEPNALHRFVWGDQGAQAGEREEVVASWPPHGVALLGNALLEEIGATMRAEGTVSLRVGEKRWQATPGSWEGEITLGAPGPAAAEARVRVLVSTGYTGSLAIEGPLARAIGLHLFEIPGDVRFVHIDGAELPVRGRRARARVRIPELDVDRVVEVQVVPAPPSRMEVTRTGIAPGLRFDGETPTAASHGEALRVDRSGSLVIEGAAAVRTLRGDDEDPPHAFLPLEGTVRVALHYPAPEPESPGVIGSDVPLLGELFREEPALVVPRAFDLGTHTLHMLAVERVTLRGEWEPGAEVTIAKVWRGTTALPSEEPVVRTRVRANEWISFPRVKGEPACTLRMLVTTKDGESTFQDIVVAPELRAQPRVEIGVRSDGYVQVGRGTAVFLYSPPWHGDQVQAFPDPAHAATLREALRKAVDLPGTRDASGTSYFEARLTVGFGTPWRLVQWVMQVAGSPGVRIARFSFRSDGGNTPATPVALPRDAGLGAGPGAEPLTVEVSLHRVREGEPLLVRVRHASTDLEVAWDPGEIERRLKDALVAVEGGPLGLQGLIRVPPPGLVHHSEVVRVIEAFRAAGIQDVRFEGAPMR